MLRIAITGPESSGKTTLCRLLSDYFKVPFISEYARTFLENTSGAYQQSDLDFIAKEHLKNILTSTHSVSISDTDFSVLEIWSEYKFKNSSKLIKELAGKDLFGLHILCRPDIPWEADKLRENEHSRLYLFDLYKASLTMHRKNFIVVDGSVENRTKKSIKFIEQLIDL
jgi:nicotinamide riboside kinase